MILESWIAFAVATTVLLLVPDSLRQSYRWGISDCRRAAYRGGSPGGLIEGAAIDSQHQKKGTYPFS